MLPALRIGYSNSLYDQQPGGREPLPTYTHMRLCRSSVGAGSQNRIDVWRLYVFVYFITHNGIRPRTALASRNHPSLFDGRW